VELVEFVRITLPFTGTGGRTPDRRPMALESSQLVGPTSEARGLAALGFLTPQKVCQLAEEHLALKEPPNRHGGHPELLADGA
jgi:hypothetical protein